MKANNLIKRTKYIKIIHAICFVMVVIFIFVIFFFSNQSASQSYQLTGTVVTAVAKEPVTQADWDFRSGIISSVRKMAHVMEYFGFGLFLVGFFESSARLSSKKQIIIVVIYYACVVLVAGLDEFNQMFVSGRRASMTDVLIDIIGATVSLVVVTVLQTFVDKKLR